jgi:hypothetical protein
VSEKEKKGILKGQILEEIIVLSGVRAFRFLKGQKSVKSVRLNSDKHIKF